ncbi:MAG TPA: condensation domain-containing protein [Thermoanaerobaculia bacterium]|nr:condensation domain-containing protein [Thermoanaerobaculia bacterium]
MGIAERLASLSPEQRALLAALRRGATEGPGQAPSPGPAVTRLPPPVAPVSGPLGLGDWPLSRDQERIWRLHQEDPGLVSWNVDAGSRVTGPVDLPALLAALHVLVRRHAAWRTVFPRAGDRPVQRVLAFLAPAASLLDLRGLPAARREAAALAAVYEHTRQPFDLARGPLLRLALVRLADREHLLLVTIHHLATDWISFQVFYGELLAVYEALQAGHPVRLAPLPLQYPDYVLWERGWWRGEVLAEEARFWRAQLAGFPLVLDLPADRPRPPVQSQRGGMLRIAVGAARSQRLRALARAASATTFMAMLAVVYALLWRLTGREKLIVGSNGANRARPELAPVAGLFLNQIPFAADLGGDPSFRELLARSRRAALAAYAHQNLPFSLLVEALGGGEDRSRYPVVQVLLLVLQRLGSSSSRAGLTFRPIHLYDGNSRWDLLFGLYDDPDEGLGGVLEYNADVFAGATVARWLDLFYRLLDAGLADPDASLSQLAARTGAGTAEPQ